MSKPSLEIIETEILDASSPKIPCVKNGVYFTVPENLPRGRHKVPTEMIVSAQRERMLIAVTELMAALGYRNFGVKEIGLFGSYVRNEQTGKSDIDLLVDYDKEKISLKKQKFLF